MNQLDTAVLLCAYRRPSTTQLVFNAIKQVKPKRLFIAVNAPRPENEDEEQKCTEVKKIATDIDWDCEVHTLLRERHLSLKESISSAIDWFFDQVEEGIILEDDCLPSTSFFWYCQELLARYRHDGQIMHINGCNHGVTNDGLSSYFFSKHIHVWGWASWREAWKLYDINMSNWTDFKDLVNFEKFFGSTIEKERKLLTWERAYKNEIDCWDYQWCYSVLTQGGCAISPTKNMIQNIGIGPGATHTFNTDSYSNNLERNEVTFPLRHPKFKVIDYDLDFL